MSSPVDQRPRTFDPAVIVARLTQSFPVPGRYWVGFSGGLDSSVLLNLLARFRAVLPAPLSAIHVDHTLHPHSRDWAAHCQQACAQLGVPLTLCRVNAAAARGHSPEAAARSARYAAIDEVLAPGDMLLTAHHRDDQAETLLLQLLRGAGATGLSAMPTLRDRRAGWLGRPLLDVDRATIRDWAESEGLAWIDDPSNAQTTADRNFLRHQIMPTLQTRWPAATERLAHSASLCAEAAEAVAVLAAADCRSMEIASAGRFRLTGLCALDVSRARSALRCWLRARGAPPIPSRRLDEALTQLCRGREDAKVVVAWAGAALRRYRNEVWLGPSQLPVATDGLSDWVGDHLDLGPGLGAVRRVSRDGGIDPQRWAHGRIQVGFRHAGLRCRPAGRTGTRSFKKLMQEQGIPPWLRDRLPVLFIDGEVAAIANCFVCAPFAVPPGKVGWQIAWWAPELGIGDSASHTAD